MEPPLQSSNRILPETSQGDVFIVIPKGKNFGISQGSGITAIPRENGFQIDYEGNIYRSQDLDAYEARVYHAASRGMTRYPTVARIFLPEEEFLENFEVIGVLNYEDTLDALRNRHLTGGSLPECVQKHWRIEDTHQEALKKYLQPQ